MFNTRSKKVLIVDDDDTVRSLCEEVLSVAGYQVDTAIHGHDGLEMLKGGRYDLVISDVNMPELDGISFYRKAVEGRPNLRERFLFVTADLSQELRTRFAGMKVKCLAKPFRITDLLGCVDTIMVKSLQSTFRNDTGKRQEDRFPVAAECDIFEDSGHRHRFLMATTENISRNGIKVRYEGEPIVPATPVSVYLCINSLSMHRTAKVKWSINADARSSASGIWLDEPLPVSSIISIMPAKAV